MCCFSHKKEKNTPPKKWVKNKKLWHIVSESPSHPTFFNWNFTWLRTSVTCGFGGSVGFFTHPKIRNNSHGLRLEVVTVLDQGRELASLSGELWITDVTDGWKIVFHWFLHNLCFHRTVPLTKVMVFFADVQRKKTRRRFHLWKTYQKEALKDPSTTSRVTTDPSSLVQSRSQQTWNLRDQDLKEVRGARPKIPVTTRLSFLVRNKDQQKTNIPEGGEITSSYITYMCRKKLPFPLHVLHHQLGPHLRCQESIEGICQFFDHLLVLVQLLQILHFWGRFLGSTILS